MESETVIQTQPKANIQLNPPEAPLEYFENGQEDKLQGGKREAIKNRARIDRNNNFWCDCCYASDVDDTVDSLFCIYWCFNCCGSEGCCPPGECCSEDCCSGGCCEGDGCCSGEGGEGEGCCSGGCCEGDDCCAGSGSGAADGGGEFDGGCCDCCDCSSD